MDTSFNKLTPAEVERLAIMIEECGEVVQACTKILRHGYEDYNPDKKPDERESNRFALARELGDVSAIAQLMASHGDFSPSMVAVHHTRKNDKLARGEYLHHNGEGRT